MFNIHTLRDTKNRKILEGPGHRLGSIHKSKLEKALCSSIKTASDIANEYKDLQGIYLKQKEDLVLVKCIQNDLDHLVSDLEDELEQISLKPDLSSNNSKMGGDAVEEISLKPDLSFNDSKTGGDAKEEVSSFSKTPSLSSHHSGLEPNESKVKDVLPPQ
ncbi:10291_t:CDS:2, partial [Dentiscutata heterogama]